ncbi:glycerate kinase [Marinithermofilum abyssi]|uniref:Glycerate kinase n=1 Tax=Marinithermofilum abyssi TaxID=1571185 RepID=A0A8J2VF39_9BACL|nr:glycerate kinase [Marinithermofilum abyssi]GGE15727.1 glycerate kinase [Marinithermofilum abyssi]
MRILIAPDSFKGSMTSLSAGKSMAAGIRSVIPNAWIEQVSLADGGEGTVDALLAACGGEKVFHQVTGPMGDPVDGYYGVLPDGRIVMEVAACSGLTQVDQKQRNPWIASTRGLGEMLRHALGRGPKEVIIGLGGSATVDGGIGFLQAIGVKVLDRDNRDVLPGGQGLAKVETMDPSSIDPRLKEVNVTVASDVDNPLIGEEGGVRVFAPQKGAGPELLPLLEEGMEHYAKKLSTFRQKIEQQAGGGSAGGLGAALLTFCNAKLESGFDLISRIIGLEEKIARSDLVLTGEGKMDSQTLHGKAPGGVACLAQKHGVPTIAFTGAIGSGVELLQQKGIAAVYSIVNAPMSEQEALLRGEELLEQAVRSFFQGVMATQIGVPAN